MSKILPDHLLLLNVLTGLYPAEIVPLKVRAPANGLSTSANWIFNFMVQLYSLRSLQVKSNSNPGCDDHPCLLLIHWIQNLHYLCRNVCFPSPPFSRPTLTNFSNAFIFPVVYFFYPETAYRSLEEIDIIFRKTQRGWRGWFGVVKTAKNEPLRYGKHGELLIDYEATEEHAFRSNSIAGVTDKPMAKGVEDVNGSRDRGRETESGDNSVLEKGENNV
jgi:hypothetical protein